jgi:DNA-binding MarR family transcriptional regulator
VAQIIKILTELSRALGIPIITPEYEIGLALLDCAGLTAEQLVEQSSFSRAGFFNTMCRLKNSGDVVSTTSPADRRSRIYRLSESTHDLILSRFKAYRAAYEQYVDQGVGDLDRIRHGVLRRRRRAFGNLSCEFQIVYYCHLFANIYNDDLRNLVDVSRTKFMTSLKALSILSIITSVTDSSDRRRKMYNIHPDIRQILDGFHGDVFRWLDGVTDSAKEETGLDDRSILPRIA